MKKHKSLIPFILMTALSSSTLAFVPTPESPALAKLRARHMELIQENSSLHDRKIALRSLRAEDGKNTNYRIARMKLESDARGYFKRLLLSARHIAEAKGIKIRDIWIEKENGWVHGIQYLPEGDAPENQFAKKIFDRHGYRLIFAPYDIASLASVDRAGTLNVSAQFALDGWKNLTRKQRLDSGIGHELLHLRLDNLGQKKGYSVNNVIYEMKNPMEGVESAAYVGFMSYQERSTFAEDAWNKLKVIRELSLGKPLVSIEDRLKAQQEFNKKRKFLRHILETQFSSSGIALEFLDKATFPNVNMEMSERPVLGKRLKVVTLKLTLGKETPFYVSNEMFFPEDKKLDLKDPEILLKLKRNTENVLKMARAFAGLGMKGLDQLDAKLATKAADELWTPQFLREIMRDYDAIRKTIQDDVPVNLNNDTKLYQQYADLRTTRPLSGPEIFGLGVVAPVATALVAKEVYDYRHKDKKLENDNKDANAQTQVQTLPAK